MSIEKMKFEEFKALLKGKELKTKCPDKIRPLVEEMNKFAERLEYERAKEILDNIKFELKKPRGTECGHSLYDIDTVRDVHDLVISNRIRLNPDSFKFADYLGLLINVYKRKDELRRMRYSDINRQRKVVAEEMACLGMTVPVHKVGNVGKKPNRAFLDIAHRVNPFVACKELERREKVLMWKAIESGKKEEIEKARERLRKYLRNE